jgi:hypothetical protein
VRPWEAQSIPSFNFPYGKLYDKAGKPRKLPFREVLNKLIHANNIRWDFGHRGGRLSSAKHRRSKSTGTAGPRPRFGSTRWQQPVAHSRIDAGAETRSLTRLILKRATASFRRMAR